MHVGMSDVVRIEAKPGALLGRPELSLWVEVEFQPVTRGRHLLTLHFADAAALEAALASIQAAGLRALAEAEAQRMGRAAVAEPRQPWTDA